MYRANSDNYLNSHLGYDDDLDQFFTASESESDCSPRVTSPMHTTSKPDQFMNTSDTNGGSAEPILVLPSELDESSLFIANLPAPTVAPSFELDANFQWIEQALNFGGNLPDVNRFQLIITPCNPSLVDNASPGHGNIQRTAPYQYTGTTPASVIATDAQIPVSTAGIKLATAGNDTHFVDTSTESRYSISKHYR